MLASIGLYQPKTPSNVGSVLRAAHCYGASMVATTGSRYHRIGTDTSAAYKSLPLLQVEDLRHALPYDSVPVAVELVDDGYSLFNYVHPKEAFYVFGPEDGSIPGHVLEWCRDIVYIPTKYCMNLAATVNVVLYDRACKAASLEKHIESLHELERSRRQVPVGA